MPDTTVISFDWNSLLIAALAVLAFAALVTSLLLCRQFLKRPVESDNSSSHIRTLGDFRERLKYCAAFFEDIYDMRNIPSKQSSAEFRLNSLAVAGAFKKSRARDICLAFRRYYSKSRPLPDYTEKYAQRLKEDSRECDILGAFCLYARDEFLRLQKELDSQPEEKSGFAKTVL